MAIAKHQGRVQIRITWCIFYKVSSMPVFLTDWFSHYDHLETTDVISRVSKSVFPTDGAESLFNYYYNHEKHSWRLNNFHYSLLVGGERETGRGNVQEWLVTRCAVSIWDKTLWKHHQLLLHKSLPFQEMLPGLSFINLDSEPVQTFKIALSSWKLRKKTCIWELQLRKNGQTEGNVSLLIAMTTIQNCRVQNKESTVWWSAWRCGLGS